MAKKRYLLRLRLLNFISSQITKIYIGSYFNLCSALILPYEGFYFTIFYGTDLPTDVIFHPLSLGDYSSEIKVTDEFF